MYVGLCASPDSTPRKLTSFLRQNDQSGNLIGRPEMYTSASTYSGLEYNASMKV